MDFQKLTERMYELYPHLHDMSFQSFDSLLGYLRNLKNDLDEDEYFGHIDDYSNSVPVRGMVENILRSFSENDNAVNELRDFLGDFDLQFKEKTIDSNVHVYNLKFDNLKWMENRIPKNAPDNIV